MQLSCASQSLTRVARPVGWETELVPVGEVASSGWLGVVPRRARDMRAHTPLLSY